MKLNLPPRISLKVTRDSEPAGEVLYTLWLTNSTESQRELLIGRLTQKGLEGAFSRSDETTQPSGEESVLIDPNAELVFPLLFDRLEFPAISIREEAENTPIVFTERSTNGYYIPTEYNPFIFPKVKTEAEPVRAAEIKVARALDTILTITMASLAIALAPSLIFGVAVSFILSPYSAFFIDFVSVVIAAVIVLFALTLRSS